jgi:hypothetical protein
MMNAWDDPSFEFDLSWLTYLSQPLASRIVPPEDTCVERMENGGLLFIATKEPFDVQNPIHMAAAVRIRDALGPINDLARHEREKRESAAVRQVAESMGLVRARRR